MRVRLGWPAAALLALAALLLLLTRGAAARVYAGDSSVFGVAYDRFTWHHARTELAIDVGPGLQRDSTLRVLISQRFLRNNQVARIVPRPLARGESGSFVYYDFVRADRRIPAHIVFQLRPQAHGTQRGVVALGDLTSVAISQLVLP